MLEKFTDTGKEVLLELKKEVKKENFERVDELSEGLGLTWEEVQKILLLI